MEMKVSHKTVIINRAVPGSGKTTISRCVNDALLTSGLSVATHSTDDFFMRGTHYCFDIQLLFRYHQQNLRNFQNDLSQGVDVVICDNTNLQPWQSAPYTNLARHYGYRILFLNFLPRELWKHVKSQVVTHEKPDAHGVPEARLVEFISAFHAYNSLFDKNVAADPISQKDYVWDDSLYRPVETGRCSMHFDADHVITISPDQYHAAKATIGKQVLQVMN